ncbi:hypothetical protein CSA37_01875 [Candidatus Fermentibacteria bacterium]|nr:MAG: hypothetical protein CSA37_01875 [Candidatus Fermentibacteria bacterium]
MFKSLFFVLLAGAVCLAGEFTVSVPVQNAALNVEREGLFTSVTIPGMPSIFAEGSPSLPLMPVRIALPTGCRATSVTVSTQTWENLPGRYDIQPASGCVPISAGIDQTQAKPDAHIYSTNAYYPGTVAELSNSSVFWGIPIAYVTVNPVRWNPVTGNLQVLSELSLAVNYEEDQSIRLISRRTFASESMAMDIVRKLVVNPEGVSESGAQIISHKDYTYGQYVIITHPDYETQAQELADWKTAKGIPTGVYTTAWIQSQYSCTDLQQEMRAFLTDCRDDGTDYVLIFGDDDKVACRDAILVGNSSYTEIAPADLYFVDINDTAPGSDRWNANGNSIWGEVPYPYQYPQPSGYDQVDYHPDLWVGRASVNSSSEADIFVDKVFIYEGIQSVDYFETAPRELRIGYSTGILWSSPYIPGSADAESISTFIPSSVWEEEKLYESNGTNSYQNTINMINAGPHHVFHASHGAETSMYTSYGSSYTTSHIMAQTNIQSGHLPAIWQSISCLIGHLDGYECCGDAWLNSPNGGGFGNFNSRYGFGNFAGPCTGPSEMLCIRFYQDHWTNDIYNLGIAHGTSMDFYSPPCSTYMDWCLKEYNLFGDPELPMWTEVPADLSVTHPASISGTGNVTFTVTAGGSPVNNARVCIQKGDWKTGECYEVGFTDASGQVTLYATPATTGTMSATVWAHNYNTYQGTISVTATAIEDFCEPVGVFAFNPVTPNPAVGSTSLNFSLAAPSQVSIDVYDLGGRKVTTLVNENMQAGSHSMVWNLRDSSGSAVPAGLYQVRLTTPEFTKVNPVMILR